MKMQTCQTQTRPNLRAISIMHACMTEGSTWLRLLLGRRRHGYRTRPGPSRPYNYSRTTSYTYYQPGDGAKAGLLKSETVEPGHAPSCVTTTYDYDGYGNKKLTMVANCPGAAGRAVFNSRSGNTAYVGVASQREADRSLRLSGSNCREWFGKAVVFNRPKYRNGSGAGSGLQPGNVAGFRRWATPSVKPGGIAPALSPPR